MTSTPSYRDYVSNAEYMKWYSEAQRQSASTIQERDKVMIDQVRSIVKDDLKNGRSPAVLDIGCSRSNLLRHLNHAVPGLDLMGGDMVTSILDENRKDPALVGIRFEEMNLLELGHEGQFDIAIVNAVLAVLDDDDLHQAVANLAATLRPGGWLLVYDFFHDFEQHLTIVEKSKTHPKGVTLRFRPYSLIRSTLSSNGFANMSFKPFVIPVDLPKRDNGDELFTYTVRSDQQVRMNFRGTLFQPWCHLTAQKTT